MRITPVVVMLALAVLAAGCGARSNTPFTAKGTIGCLKSHGFTRVSSSPAKVGFIAGFAANGGLIGTSSSGNQVTIAFTDSSGDVDSTEKAFTLHASPQLRPHIKDVMSTNRNAVIVWTTGASSDDQSTLNGCLKP
ncbi:MAG: hypothetical protein ABUS54_06975 [Actinomycetota bacterium]